MQVGGISTHVGFKYLRLGEITEGSMVRKEKQSKDSGSMGRKQGEVAGRVEESLFKK